MLNKARDLILQRLGPQADAGEGGDLTPKIFAYADVNCNLLVRRGQQTFAFNNKNELNRIVEDLTRSY